MLKARKMKSKASSAIFANLFKNYFRVQNMVAFYSIFYKNFIDCFVLEFSTVDSVSRFQSRICIAIQEKENEILYIAR